MENIKVLIKGSRKTLSLPFHKKKKGWLIEFIRDVWMKEADLDTRTVKDLLKDCDALVFTNLELKSFQNGKWH